MARTFCETLAMVVKGCNAEFYSGANGIEEIVLKCATQIYIAQINTPKESESK